jgi:hypothetical protein
MVVDLVKFLVAACVRWMEYVLTTRNKKYIPCFLNFFSVPLKYTSVGDFKVNAGRRESVKMCYISLCVMAYISMFVVIDLT